MSAVQAGAAASAAAGAIGSAESSVEMEEFSLPPMPDTLPPLPAEIVSPGDHGKVKELALIPSAVANAAVQIGIDLVFHVEAETGRAGGIAGAAAVAPCGNLLPDILQSRTFESGGDFFC